MALRDRAIEALRLVFGDEREARAAAASPSAAAAAAQPTTVFSTFGREEQAGLLSVSQSLIDRLAEYESMEEYPDIGCLAEGTLVYTIENSIIAPVPIESLAKGSNVGSNILGFDVSGRKLTKVAALHPRLTSLEADVVLLDFGQHKIRCTPDHKILTTDGYIEAKDLRAGAQAVGMWAGFDSKTITVMVTPRFGLHELKADPKPDGKAKVYDITTETHNFVAAGIVVHNSSFRYYANDATQPNITNNRTVWVEGDDHAVVGLCDDLLKKKLKVEDESWSQAYSLGMYGNEYNELLVTEDGIVGLNHLPAPTMRRVEALDGGIIGYVQDITGQFSANSHELRTMLAGNVEVPPNIALFEDWQVVHMRLRGTRRRSPYGMCIPADGQVWTTAGPKDIALVRVGDEVLVRHCGLLRTTSVVDTFSNGVKPVFKLKTTHRTIRATANHPFLRWRGGKNNTWETLGDLKPGDEIVVCGAQPETGNPPPFGVIADRFDDATPVRLTDRGCEALRARSPKRAVGSRRTAGLEAIFLRLGYTRAQAHEIKNGQSSLKLADLRSLFDELGIGLFVGSFQVYRDPSENSVQLPDFATERVCRLLGFLLGDGWLTEHQVYFARGTDEDQNRFYEAELSAFGVPVSFTADKSQAYVSSKRLVDAIRSLGWIDGAHEKRVPSWVFTLPIDYRRAFLTGFVDADGWTSQQTGPTRYHVELCNRELVRDLKCLVDGLGWTCGNIRERAAREGKIRAGLVTYHGGKLLPADQVLRGGPSFTITWHETPLGEDGFAVERIEGVEPDGEEEVFDIGVADSDHNFICDGVVAHNSVAEPARWIWKRLIILEDIAVIYRLNRVPRYVYRVDVTDVPPGQVESFLRKLKRDIRKRKFVNPRTGRFDARYGAMCLAGDTKIPLLNGQERTVEEMAAAFDRGEQQWVYSADVTDAGRITPGKVVWAGKTRRDAQLLKVTLDNGETLRVTPDHKMIRRSGEFVEAQALVVGDSLMPFRRGTRKIKKHLPGYEMVYDPKTRRYDFTHRIVARDLLGKQRGDGQVTHHVNFDSFNNDPSNLKLMPWGEHLELHRQLGFNGSLALIEARRRDPGLDARCRAASADNITKYNTSPKKRAATAAHNKINDSGKYIRHYNASPKHDADNAIRCAATKTAWQDVEHAAEWRAAMTYSFPDEFFAGIRALIAANPNAGAARIAALANQSELLSTLRTANPTKAKKIKSIHRAMLENMVRGAGFETFREFKQTARCDNHKVAKIEWLTEREDTWCITVEGTHTFATSAGVFIKNSQDEDIFIAVREGRDLAGVEILSAPDWDTTSELDYFKRMLHGTLNVPRAWLGQDEPIQGKGVLSNEDVRAARTTLNLQMGMRQGYERMCRVHLAARGHKNPFKPEFDVCMTVPSGIWELVAYETMNARADYAARVAPFTSIRWIQENVFKWSEETIKQIEKQKKKESEEGNPFAAMMGGQPPPPPQPLPQDQDKERSSAPGTADEEPSQRPRSPAEWRAWDQARRLEEWRYNESNRRHSEIVDKLGKVMAVQDSQFAINERARREFLDLVKESAFRTSRGQVMALPSSATGNRRNGSHSRSRS